MAETETRLETLEDEVKVLKGEVKRTLVDLRALLMREDSPLGEGAAAKRMAVQNVVPAGRPAAGAPPVNEAPDPPSAPEALPGPGPDAPQAISQALAGPGPGPPPDAASLPQALSTPDDNSLDGAQQEGTMARKDPEIAESDYDDEPARRKKPMNPAGADTDDRQNAFAGSSPEDGPPGDGPEGDGPEEDEPSDDPPRSGRKGRSRAGLMAGLEEDRQLDRGAVPGEKKSGSRVKSERVTSIYDEYRELLEETKQTHTIEDQAVGPPLDVNLMANLVYWASLAKQRVGETQLKDILHLYIQSGHSRPELQDLMLQICKMVDVESAIVEENGSDWVDLLFHLHGILTGGFPVIKIPYIGLLAQEEA